MRILYRCVMKDGNRMIIGNVPDTSSVLQQTSQYRRELRSGCYYRIKRVVINPNDVSRYDVLFADKVFD